MDKYQAFHDANEMFSYKFCLLCLCVKLNSKMSQEKTANVCSVCIGQRVKSNSDYSRPLWIDDNGVNQYNLP